MSIKTEIQKLRDEIARSNRQRQPVDPVDQAEFEAWVNEQREIRGRREIASAAGRDEERDYRNLTRFCEALEGMNHGFSRLKNRQNRNL